MKVVLHKLLVRERFKQKRAYSLGLGCLQAYLRAHEPDVEVAVVPEASGILGQSPDLIGLSAVTEMWPRAAALIRELREGFDGPIIVGGTHISALPGNVPAEADLAVIGEGEGPLLDIVRRLRDGQRLDDPPIPGTASRDAQGRLVCVPGRPLLSMDDLPLPPQEGQEMVAISTVRGCPFRCAHCVETKLFPKVRQLSAEALANALVHYADTQGATAFELLDDLFIAFPKRLYELRDLLKARGLLGKFRFSRVSLCAHMCTDESMKALRDIGVADCGIGVESAHPRVLHAFKKGVVTVDHLRNAIRLAHEHDLNLGGSMVLGFPGETEEEMVTTIDFINRAREEYGFNLWTAYVCQPLPPSELWQSGVAAGELSEDMDFSTLRIDADTNHFSSEWYYGNEKALPRERFVEILDREGFVRNGVFRPEPTYRPSLPRRVARKALSVLRGALRRKET